MDKPTTQRAVELRYGGLADSGCCLSCGTAAQRLTPKLGQVCVDLGSGRGTDVLRLAEQVGEAGHAYGLDITDAMLDKARKTAAKLGVKNATFLRSELEALELPDATADWVTSNCVLNHARDKAKVWREIARVLKPGARFVVSDIYAAEEISAVWRDDPSAIAECWAGAVTREVYLGHLAQAGLVDVRVVDESASYDKGHARVVSFTVSGQRPYGAAPRTNATP